MEDKKSPDHHEQIFPKSEQEPNNLSGSSSSDRFVPPCTDVQNIQSQGVQIQEEGEAEISRTKLIKCKICNKIFRSGMALGGHVSIHLKDEAQLPVCFVCGKKYDSMKGLCSHMKAHRDRKWTGIRPPPQSNVDSPNPETSLPTWASHKKRGYCKAKDDIIDVPPLKVPALSVEQNSIVKAKDAVVSFSCVSTSSIGQIPIAEFKASASSFIALSDDRLEVTRVVSSFDLNELPEMEEDDEVI